MIPPGLLAAQNRPMAVEGGLCYVLSGADTVEVADMAALESAVNGAPPGREILLAPGSYTGGTWTFSTEGTAQAPIVIRPRDGLGTVTINGASWSLTGQRLVVERLYFTSSQLEMFGAHNRITRCRFRDISTRCIRPRRADMRIDHCDFADWTDSTQTNKNAIWFDGRDLRDFDAKRILIDHNYFHDITPSVGANSQEPIAYGTGTQDARLLAADALIYRNLFSNISIPNEGELISVKCGAVTVQENTFVNCPSMYVSYRSAIQGVARSNWLEAPMTSAAFNFWGDDHLVIGNRLVGSLRYRIGAGTGYVRDFPAPQYEACRDLRLIGNIGETRIGGYWSSGGDTHPALRTAIEAHSGTVTLQNEEGTTEVGATNVPYTPATRLAASDVGLEAPDPLCP